MDSVNGVVSAVALGSGSDEVHQDARDQRATGDDQWDGPGPGEAGSRITVSLTEGARRGVSAQGLQQVVGAGFQAEEEDDGTDARDDADDRAHEQPSVEGVSEGLGPVRDEGTAQTSQTLGPRGPCLGMDGGLGHCWLESSAQARLEVGVPWPLASAARVNRVNPVTTVSISPGSSWLSRSMS